jgi:tripartite ATP-independent transporter DctP family solute receptor
MKKVLALLLALLFVLSIAGCGSAATPTATQAPTEAPADTTEEPTEAPSEEPTMAAEPEFIFRYADNQPEDYPTTVAARRFADLVFERTNGRIKIEVYGGAQLGDEKSVIEQLQFGGIDFCRVSASPLAEFSPSLNVLQMPYLYRDEAHMWKVLDGQIGQDFLNSLDDAGFIGLSWYGSGSRSFYNSLRPINTLEDLAGLKIRVQENDLMMGMVKALGANPTPMAYGEVYGALQTGTIDGAENNWPSYESTSHYEVAKYYVLDQHTRVPEPQLMSKVTANKLSAEDLAIIKECAKESALYQRELWTEREKVSEEKVRAAGNVITELSPEEMAKFVEACQPLYKEFCSDYMGIIADIRAIE